MRAIIKYSNQLLNAIVWDGDIVLFKTYELYVAIIVFTLLNSTSIDGNSGEFNTKLQ